MENGIKRIRGTGREGVINSLWSLSRIMGMRRV